MRKIAGTAALVAALAVGLMTLVMAQSKDSAQPVGARWEYKVLNPAELAGLVRIPSMAEISDSGAKEEREQAAMRRLNDLGSEGWELFEIANDYYYFKRQI